VAMMIPHVSINAEYDPNIDSNNQS